MDCGKQIGIANDAEIASLKAENAELKKRLAKFEADRMPFEQQTCGRRK